jgi:hypothetical protein
MAVDESMKFYATKLESIPSGLLRTHISAKFRMAWECRKVGI